MVKRHGLGKGLSSLIPKNKNNEKTESIKSSTNSDFSEVSRSNVEKVLTLSVHKIFPNKYQPRMYFDEEALDELANSIKEHGILQPLVVIKNGDIYELIAGERRLRAAKLSGLTHVPAIVKNNLNEDRVKLELAIIENVQRSDLNVIEEAKSYKKLAEEFGLSQEEISKKTGKSRSAIANRMRLSNLPIEVQRGLIDGKITEGHAKLILSLPDKQKQLVLFREICKKGLSVRNTEKLLQSLKNMNFKRNEKNVFANKKERQIEDELSLFFGTKTKVKIKEDGSGFINIAFFTKNGLDDVLKKLDINKKD